MPFILSETLPPSVCKNLECKMIWTAAYTLLPCRKHYAFPATYPWTINQSLGSLGLTTHASFVLVTLQNPHFLLIGQSVRRVSAEQAAEQAAVKIDSLRRRAEEAEDMSRELDAERLMETPCIERERRTWSRPRIFHASIWSFRWMGLQK